MAEHVKSVTLHRLRLPLAVPYKLALGVVEVFDTILVEVTGTDGGTGYGEATLLTGYTEETIDQAWDRARDSARMMPGRDTDTALRQAHSLLPAAPFTATGLATALEMLRGHPLLLAESERRVPLLAIVGAGGGEPLATELEAFLDRGYRTFKVKIGFDVEADLAHVAEVQSVLAGRGSIRLDANQGYDADQACRFLRGLQPEGIELVEQTCAAGDWEAAARVAQHAHGLPLMLDESIYGIEDIRRAAELGCARFIKFKLMKAGGLDRLVDCLNEIRARGMQPVLGNGVASDVGCWMEACVAAAHVDNAGEMNGFLKPADPVVCEPMQVVDGDLVLPARWRPVLDHDAISAHCVERVQF